MLNQGWYDNIIAVDPANPDIVWAGGIDLFRSDDGGANWGQASHWWFTRGVDPEYAHADHHTLVFHPGYNGTSNRMMYNGSDGGVYRTDDARAPVSFSQPHHAGEPRLRQHAPDVIQLDGPEQRLRDDAVLPRRAVPRRGDVLRRHAGQRHDPRLARRRSQRLGRDLRR